MKTISLFFFLLTSISAFSQTQQFHGTWTKLNTTYKFEFQLILKTEGKNQVHGYFIWKVIDYDQSNQWSKEYYGSKLNLTAREFVKGTYDPKTGEYRLRGYKKEDSHQIIGMDTYQLKVDKNGNLGGTTNANGTWLGRINGKSVEMDLL